MEGNVNTEHLEDQGDANSGIAGAENQGQQQENTTELSWREQAIAYAKENGREVSSFDEFLKPVEVEKEVVKEVPSAYEKFITEEDKQYFKYAEETGRTRREFESLNKNWDEVPNLVLAREKVKLEYGTQNLTDEDIDSFIERELGIEIEELDSYGQIKLAGYAKTLRDQRKAEQEKYRQPIENKTELNQESPIGEYIQLPGGIVQRKEDYEAAQAAQLKQKEEAVQAVKTVTSASFTLPVDNDGTITNVALPYAYGDEDHRVMESIVSDVPGTLQKRYASEQGFNHAAFAEDMLWSDKNFREKAISDIATKAHANAVEETLKRVGNHSFKPDQPIETQTKEGVRIVPFHMLGR